MSSHISRTQLPPDLPKLRTPHRRRTKALGRPLFNVSRQSAPPVSPPPCSSVGVSSQQLRGVSPRGSSSADIQEWLPGALCHLYPGSSSASLGLQGPSHSSPSLISMPAQGLLCRHHLSGPPSRIQRGLSVAPGRQSSPSQAACDTTAGQTHAPPVCSCKRPIRWHAARAPGRAPASSPGYLTTAELPTLTTSRGLRPQRPGSSRGVSRPSLRA
ncbi:hypothetical protein NDU88_006856 [Pleurodeles waltl]|uniref:Uncharacterized protein n=1 Tax=Pleurodeles waltl TaxID=8319 RepID=A0AAV7WFP0_PLEWA|nr:hypothetical protein NDU88_006856 [Pleurodeles waltl]